MGLEQRQELRQAVLNKYERLGWWGVINYETIWKLKRLVW
jgi:hypothetical protein